MDTGKHTQRRPNRSKNLETIEPLAAPVARGHLLVGCSQSSFYKIWIGEGWVAPVDLGGRGQSVIVDEVRAAIRKRAEAIRSGAIVPPIRSARGKKSAVPRASAVIESGKPKSASTLQSWELDTWPADVWPHANERARWIARAYRKELIAAGALTRVGTTLVFIGAPYSRWLERRSRHVVEFASSNPEIGNLRRRRFNGDGSPELETKGKPS